MTRIKPLDEKIRELLKELGTAINESISASNEVNERIQKIRDEGYDLYVVLDATIGLNKNDDEGTTTEQTTEIAVRGREVQFRIDVQDLNFLRSVGIDPTRKVKSVKRLEERTSLTANDAEDN